jgi:hypothetical protein
LFGEPACEAEMPRPEERPTPQLTALERAALMEANAWVVRVLDALAKQERAVAGGWPGTVSEARVLVLSRIAPNAAPGSAVTAAELEALVRLTYVTAKKAWLAQAVANPSL